MRIVVSSQGEDLDAPVSPVFGRCPVYVFVDTDSLEVEVLPNPAMAQGGGAGIQAAQFVVNQGAQAVLTGNLGPNAFDVLRAADVPGYLVADGTVRQVVQAFKSGQLQPMVGASVSAHSGMRGGGRGMGAGRGGRPSMSEQSSPVPAQDAEMADLRNRLKDLRQQLAETMDRIEKLEHGTKDA